MMILSNAIAILKKAKIKQAKQEVWDLLAVALNKNKSEVILTHRPTDKIMSKKFDAYIKKRAGGFPFAYVVGYQPFLGQNYLVTKDTSIPRPATEDLVLAVEKYLNKINKPIKIYDIGTGSGCIAISLGLRCPDKIKSLAATDISASALKISRKNLISNSRELEIKKMIIFKKADLLKDIVLPKNCVVVANLPYVARDAKTALGKGEPKKAIFCKYENGLPVPYLELFKQIRKQKNPPQTVFLEMPRTCSFGFQKLWRSTLPQTPLFIIGV